MSRFTQAAVILAGAVCMLVVVASSKYTANVQVFCDPCRISVLTALSQPMAGATVRLECRKWSDNSTTFVTEGVTDNRGACSLVGEPKNPNDICGVDLVRSSRPGDCDQTIRNGFTQTHVDPGSPIGEYTGPRLGNPRSFTVKKENVNASVCIIQGPSSAIKLLNIGG